MFIIVSCLIFAANLQRILNILIDLSVIPFVARTIFSTFATNLIDNPTKNAYETLKIVIAMHFCPVCPFGSGSGRYRHVPHVGYDASHGIAIIPPSPRKR